MASAAIIKTLATALTTIYKAKNPLVNVAKDLLLNESDLGSVLKQFNDEGIFKDVVEKAASIKTPFVNDPTVRAVIAMIQNYQILQGLPSDGILGQRTQNKFLSRVFSCVDPPDRSKLPVSSNPMKPGSPGAGGMYAIRYFVISLPKVVGFTADQVEGFLQEAFDCWCRGCPKLDIQRERSNRKFANILVSCEPLGLGPSVLGLGQIGPPGDQQLTLKFEFNRSFDLPTFATTATHEIGHNLGIKHERVGAGALMYFEKQTGITFPQTADISVANQIWT